MIKLNNNDNDFIYEGIRLDDTGHYVFDKLEDFPTDLLCLAKDTSGIHESDNITYIYGYTFNNNVPKELQRDFRNALKHEFDNSDLFYDDSVYDFVEDGVFALDRYKKLEDFKVLVTVRPTSGENSLLDYISSIIMDYTQTGFLTFGFLKKLCSEVTFDEEKAFKTLKNTEKYGIKSDAEIRKIVHRITKQLDRTIRTNPNELFQIKRYSPVLARIGFSSFLRFKNKFEENVYRNLENGTDVLICDDFVTSGSTLSEMRSFLTAINPNNKITAFALINQQRQY